MNGSDDSGSRMESFVVQADMRGEVSFRDATASISVQDVESGSGTVVGVSLRTQQREVLRQLLQFPMSSLGNGSPGPDGLAGRSILRGPEGNVSIGCTAE